MNTIISLQNKAIEAAKNADWPTAKAVNEEILTLEANNINALNRLAVCLLQLGNTSKARQTFQQVLTLDPANSIATKQLANIKQNTVKAPAFSAQQFIEEPGRSKIITLHRLAAKNILEQLHVGQELLLKPKSRYISIETTDKVYVGSLPEDISLRLTKLISTGNLYHCQVHSFSHNTCNVFIKEISRSPENQDKLSFAVVKGSGDNSADLGDDLFLENDIPLNLHDTDQDTEGRTETDLSNLDNDED